MIAPNRKLILPLLAIVVLAFLLAGCGEGSLVAPTNNEGEVTPPPPQVKIPIKMGIDHIRIIDFPTTKSNGDNWDWDPFSSGPRRPDIYFQLGNHVTNTWWNVSVPASNVYLYARFNGNPCRMNLGNNASYTIVMYDDDGGLTSPRDEMARATIIPAQMFNPNATYNDDTFSGIRVNGSNGMVVTLSGKWIY